MNNNTVYAIDFVERHGIENAKIHYQLSANELHDMTIASGQGIETSTGALAINGRIYRTIPFGSIYR
jgi:phosphoenolpyruvate carboxykinase (ATP)